MSTPPRLLCISNGHGEDAIAGRVLTAVRSRLPQVELAALPMVGTGATFEKQGIPLIAATKSLPSGGFIYMDSRQLARDLQGGLLSLTWMQWQALKTWAQKGGQILAVGDVVPMAFAWWSGLPYGLMGTAKSAYYLRDEQGRLPGLPWYAGWASSIYLPWERWFMTRDRCRLTVVRDELTAQELTRLGIGHVYVGNPMMDCLEPSESRAALPSAVGDPLTIVLLPGSRTPEVYCNWSRILQGAAAVQRQLAPRPVQFLGAIAPAVELNTVVANLAADQWQPLPAATHLSFQRGNSQITLTQTAYAECLHRADAAIAMAGTATEQFVGLGKPAFIFPGAGPQFTPTFAKLQARLLGPSVIWVETPEDVGLALDAVMKDPKRLMTIRQNGQRRMGPPGASEAIAQLLATRLPLGAKTAASYDSPCRDRNLAP